MSNLMEEPKELGDQVQRFLAQHGRGVMVVMGLILKWSICARWKISKIELLFHGLPSGLDAAYFQVEEQQRRPSYSVTNAIMATNHKQPAPMAQEILEAQLDVLLQNIPEFEMSLHISPDDDSMHTCRFLYSNTVA